MVYYDVIPLLTLLSSCLSLLFNVIGKLYRYRDHDVKTFSDRFSNKNDEPISDVSLEEKHEK